MKVKALKYLLPLTFYVLAIVAFTGKGWLVWLPVLFSWVLIPVVELFLRPNTNTLTAAEMEIAKTDRMYDWMLYIVVPLQYLALLIFLFFMQQPLTSAETAGRIMSMGMICGIFGINVAHELGHRKNKIEQALAKLLLATSLYMHFFIEHNKGHHKHVATPADPSSARMNEPVYFFYPRTIIFTYLSAWRIANDECKSSTGSKLSWRNEMIRFHVFQLLLLCAIGSAFGPTRLLYFITAACMGILLLETVNYIEHYGLQRRQIAGGKYERAMPEHSWNSSHPIGRIMLFELSRHSDHHYLASKKYQLLQHHEDAPQLPTGYPGSMLLALAPPVWFGIMNKKIRKIQQSNG